MELHLTAWDATCKEFGLVITRQLMGDNAGVPIDRLFELVLEHNGTNPAEIDREMVGLLCNVYRYSALVRCRSSYTPARQPTNMHTCSDVMKVWACCDVRTICSFSRARRRCIRKSTNR
eukprot:366130-Chlamydomonas_euryale.AAC.7